MVRIITVDDIRDLIHKVTLKSFTLQLLDRLEKDFLNWESFDKVPRLGNYFPHGVIELMPVSDQDYYSFKFVNCHPNNPRENKQTVVAIGTLADIATGYPVMIAEMTILTAIRTAVTSALASKYMAVPAATRFGIIGTGAQSEFQVLAHHFALDVDEVYYFDVDKQAMLKFQNNLKSYGIDLYPCKSAEEVAKKSQIVTTATAEKACARVLHAEWLSPGVHVNAIGGDCPGKTELDTKLLQKSRIVVEYIQQSKNEGEIQHIGVESVYAELWELISGKKVGRQSEQEITLFDSVGVALEDYSILRLVSKLADEYQVGHMLDMVPENSDPKSLFSQIL